MDKGTHQQFELTNKRGTCRHEIQADRRVGWPARKCADRRFHVDARLAGARSGNIAEPHDVFRHEGPHEDRQGGEQGAEDDRGRDTEHPSYPYQSDDALPTTARSTAPANAPTTPSTSSGAYSAASR